MDPLLWSGLPTDVQLIVAQKLRFPHFLRAKLVCKGWYREISGCSRVYSWVNHVICNGKSKEVNFRYLPQNRLYLNILSCSKDGLMLLHIDSYAQIFSLDTPLVVTNPVTRRWLAVPYPKPKSPDITFAVRLHAQVLDTPHSFAVLLVQTSAKKLEEPVQGIWVNLYKPETGWKTKFVDLGNDKLVCINRVSPVQPLVFDGRALYFLTVSSSSSFHSAAEYTLNCVQVKGGDGSGDVDDFRLEKVHSWSTLPCGMWPVPNRPHPKLVLCSGHLLLVGASFIPGSQPDHRSESTSAPVHPRGARAHRYSHKSTSARAHRRDSRARRYSYKSTSARGHPRDARAHRHLSESTSASGQRWPVVLLAFEMKTKSWTVFDEGILPGFAAKSLTCRFSNIFEGIECGMLKSMFKVRGCAEDLFFTACEDELLVSFFSEGSAEEYPSNHYSYDFNTRSWSAFTFPKIKYFSVRRAAVTRMSISGRGRIPGVSPQNSTQ